jgi:hypothetical protein
MQWTKKDAHLVLRMRAQVLDECLGETFRDWYSDFPDNTCKRDQAGRVSTPGSMLTLVEDTLALDTIQALNRTSENGKV